MDVAAAQYIGDLVVARYNGIAVLVMVAWCVGGPQTLGTAFVLLLCVVSSPQVLTLVLTHACVR